MTIKIIKFGEINSFKKLAIDQKILNNNLIKIKAKKYFVPLKNRSKYFSTSVRTKN
jgi:hypothetical protein